MEKKYHEMMDYVTGLLDGDTAKANTYQNAFRSPLTHTKRVVAWAKRIMNCTQADEEVVMIAAIFHDCGKSVEHKDHPSASAALCKEFLLAHRYPEDKIQNIVSIIQHHDRAYLFNREYSSVEHLILLEADNLDESGAMTILRDCLDEGSEKNISYLSTLKRLKTRSIRNGNNPFVTEYSKKIWQEKRIKFIQFIEDLEFDLAVEDSYDEI
jgi:uncharacterized protein